MSKSEKKQAASIVWFEIPADNPERAIAFYSNLFGWKINPFPGGGDYWHIDTGGADDTPVGELKGGGHPEEQSATKTGEVPAPEFPKRTKRSVGKSCIRKPAEHRWANFPF